MKEDIQVRNTIIKKIEEDNTTRNGAQPPIGSERKKKRHTEGLASSMEHFEAIKALIQY